MKRLRHAITLASLVAVSIVGLYGCGGESPTATTIAPTATTAVEVATATTAAMEAPTATTATTTSDATATTGTTSSGGSGSAVDMLKSSGEAMKSVKSYHIVLKTDAAGTSTTGEGDFVVPDKARLSMGTAAGNVNVIIVDNTTYTQIPGSDAYIESGSGVSPLGASTDTSGFAELAQNATVVGDETLDGVETTHIKFSYDGDKAMAQSGVTSGTNMNLGTVDADVWIEKATNYTHQLKTSSTVAGTPSSTTITYSKFNE